jgi:hypothetical protein
VTIDVVEYTPGGVVEHPLVRDLVNAAEVAIERGRMTVAPIDHGIILVVPSELVVDAAFSPSISHRATWEIALRRSTDSRSCAAYVIPGDPDELGAEVLDLQYTGAQL